jgi:hypothetical protein
MTSDVKSFEEQDEYRVGVEHWVSQLASLNPDLVAPTAVVPLTVADAKNLGRASRVEGR